jgi:hypothetical protein
MARLDWDRLRRARALDGADVRVDADGARVWERTGDASPVAFGRRRLRHGVVVRRRATPACVTTAQAEITPERRRAGPIRCTRCGARVSPRKLLRHARRCPAREP